mmetsp:Transcript_103607/g.259828  ORF Transcript_103607/g.259828 Transcript_103607/m.259828 type:complete len:210 (-) Transcript_103607:120-749(-)
MQEVGLWDLLGGAGLGPPRHCERHAVIGQRHCSASIDEPPREQPPLLRERRGQRLPQEVGVCLLQTQRDRGVARHREGEGREEGLVGEERGARGLVQWHRAFGACWHDDVGVRGGEALSDDAIEPRQRRHRVRARARARVARSLAAARWRRCLQRLGSSRYRTPSSFARTSPSCSGRHPMTGGRPGPSPSSPRAACGATTASAASFPTC